MAGSPRSTSAAPRAPRALTGTHMPVSADTAGSTPAVSTLLQTTCKTNPTAPTKTERPPIPESRLPVTDRRGSEPPGWGVGCRRATFFKPIIVLLCGCEGRKHPRATLTLYMYTVQVGGYLYGVQLSSDGWEKRPKRYSQGHPYPSDCGRAGARARRSGRAQSGHDPEVGQGARRDAHGPLLALSQQGRALGRHGGQHL